MTEIHGTFDSSFGPLRDAFAANFETADEVGASVAVTIDGETVVDLWGGDATPTGDPWQQDTIVNVYSTTKTMAATCVLMLADEGLIDLYAPVANYWPEFAQNGKAEVTVAQVMSHSAGLSGFEPARTVEELYDWDLIVDGLAAQKPWFTPGEFSAYHAVTQGYLQGELVRRVSGVSIGEFFRTRVAEPLNADFHIGLDEAHDHRVGELIPPDMSIAQGQADADPTSLPARTLLSAPMDGTEPRTRAWRGAEIPAAGGTGNARSVARVHSALACGGSVDGVTLMSPEGVERILECQTDGMDPVLGAEIRHGMGFGLPSEAMPISPSERACFWGGWGGSIAVIDFEKRMSVAYVMNRMASDLMGDTRGGVLVLTAYACLGG